MLLLFVVGVFFYTCIFYVVRATTAVVALCRPRLLYLPFAHAPRLYPRNDVILGNMCTSGNMTAYGVSILPVAGVGVHRLDVWRSSHGHTS